MVMKVSSVEPPETVVCRSAAMYDFMDHGESDNVEFWYDLLIGWRAKNKQRLPIQNNCG